MASYDGRPGLDPPVPFRFTRRTLLKYGGALGIMATAGTLHSTRLAGAASVMDQTTVTYKTVDGEPLDLHAWRPAGWAAGQRRPAVVFYHGGAWLNGEWHWLESQPAYLATRGLVTFSVEYRTAGPLIATLDAIDAINFIFGHTHDLGIDGSKVVAAGGSAGGHLALSTLRDDLPHSNPAAKPSAAILFNPVTNTTGQYPDGWGRNQFEDDEQAEMYSPHHHITADHPPTLIMHGTADTTVSLANASAYVQKVRESGGHATLVSYDGQGHGFFNKRDYYNRYYYETVREADRFLESIGYLAGAQTIQPEHPLLVRNGGFERGLDAWQTGSETVAQVSDHPVHHGRLAISVMGRSGPGVLAQDIADDLRRHGPGEYLLGAWVAAAPGAPAEATLALRVKGADDPDWRRYPLPPEPVPGADYTLVSGTRNISWAGRLESAQVEVSVASGQMYIDEVRVEFLPARVGWWRFTERTEDAVTDTSGYHLDGRLAGGTWISDGNPGGAVRFENAQGGLELPNIVDPGVSDFRLRLWLRLETETSSRQVTVRQDASWTKVWLYWDPATASLATEIDGRPLVSSRPLPAGTWTEAALVRAGDRIDLYMAGERVASRSETSVQPARAGMIIGAPPESSGSVGWHGSVDEITFWDHA